MSNVTLYGPSWSAYTRTVRLALIEKAVEYNLTEVDFSTGVMPAEHFNLHPFGKVPVLQHEEFVIYETSPMCRYIDEAFKGPALQPPSAQLVGRMAQIIAILDAYLSFELRVGFVNEALFKPMIGLTPDDDRVASARENIQKGFGALGNLVSDSGFIAGPDLTLADLHAVPLFDYLDKTPGGTELINSQPKLRAWWLSVKTRPSVLSTEPDLSVFSKTL